MWHTKLISRVSLQPKQSFCVKGRLCDSEDGRKTVRRNTRQQCTETQTTSNKPETTTKRSWKQSETKGAHYTNTTTQGSDWMSRQQRLNPGELDETENNKTHRNATKHDLSLEACKRSYILPSCMVLVYFQMRDFHDSMCTWAYSLGKSNTEGCKREKAPQCKLKNVKRKTNPN